MAADPNNLIWIDMEMTGLDLTGEGWVVLGQPLRATDIRVLGGYTLTFPDDASVRIIGQATVPDDWTQVPDGWSSPVQGPGWVVTVAAGSTVTVNPES